MINSKRTQTKLLVCLLKCFFNWGKRAFIVQDVWISCHVRLRYCDSWNNPSRTSCHMNCIQSGRMLSFFFSNISYIFPNSFLQANVQSKQFLLEWHVARMRSHRSASSPFRCKTEVVWSLDSYPQFAFKYVHSQCLYPDKTTRDTAIIYLPVVMYHNIAAFDHCDQLPPCIGCKALPPGEKELRCRLYPSAFCIQFCFLWHCIGYL